ncbi:hypothetical protein C8D87_104127 [Lentzea atacamensis]|uniref:Uncharacterized protein n=1 Tax=Lentzea atacamensis TaxID=531938 RepID=A0ABX9E9Z1_9PSEU|nr:hypothetical protein C8D87_104127 [Lentzea atacamensis]
MSESFRVKRVHCRVRQRMAPNVLDTNELDEIDTC